MGHAPTDELPYTTWHQFFRDRGFSLSSSMYGLMGGGVLSTLPTFSMSPRHAPFSIPTISVSLPPPQIFYFLAFSNSLHCCIIRTTCRPASVSSGFPDLRLCLFKRACSPFVISIKFAISQFFLSPSLKATTIPSGIGPLCSSHIAL